jgi:uncharacterized membrane protein YvlD (DUF360 family)
MSFALPFAAIWFMNLVALIFTRVLVPGLKLRTSRAYIYCSFILALVGFTAFPLLLALGIPLLIASLWFFQFFATSLALFLGSDQIPGMQVKDSSSIYLGSTIIATTNWLIAVVWNLSYWLS